MQWTNLGRTLAPIADMAGEAQTFRTVRCSTGGSSCDFAHLLGPNERRLIYLKSHSLISLKPHRRTNTTRQSLCVVMFHHLGAVNGRASIPEPPPHPVEVLGSRHRRHGNSHSAGGIPGIPAHQPAPRSAEQHHASGPGYVLTPAPPLPSSRARGVHVLQSSTMRQALGVT